MFTKSKVSQSLVDAVKNIIGESGPLKVPTATGMKVYGRSYGNSAKAKQDQTKSSVDDLKGPKTKELLQKDKEEHMKTKGKYDEAAKPDYLDFDKDGDKKEPMKKALADKEKVQKEEVKKEELKGDQHKIDKNKNNKIDAQDFAILRGQKKVKEDMYFAKKLIEGMKRSDIPASVRKARGDAPLTPAEVKSGSKDSISDPKNLAKARNEEVEQIDEKNVPTSPEKWAKAKSAAKSKFAVYPSAYANGWASKKYKAMGGGWKTAKEEVEFENEELIDELINEVLSKDATAGDWIHDFVHSDNPKFAGKSKAKRKEMALAAYYAKQRNESYENPDSQPITTDTLAGRMPGGKFNSFKSFKIRVRPLDKEGEQNPKDATPEIIQPDDTPARKSHETKQTLKTEGKRPETDDAPPFEQPYTKIQGNIKDKSGAVHTPMSRARDLARTAMKKVKSEMLGKIGTSESKK